VAVPLRILKHTRFVRRNVIDVDLTGRKLTARDPWNRHNEMSWDRSSADP